MRKWEKADKPQFVFAHVGRKWLDFVRWGIEHSDHCWTTVRSPIHTWGTHWGNVHDSLQSNSDAIWKDQLGKIRGQYETLIQLVDEYPDLYIHPVEDPITDLGDYLGLELTPNHKTFSRNTEMKDALRRRDLHKINELCYGTDFFECFRDSITPDIKDFYERLGYDIWWTDG